MTGPAPRPEILTIAAYVAGDSQAPGANRVIKLSSNEGAFGPPVSAQAAYCQVAAEIHRYPDGDSTALRKAIGNRFRLDPAKIVCGTGSDELIQHLCHIYGGPGTDIVMSQYGFTMYEISGTYAGSRVLKAPEVALTTDVDNILALANENTKIVFIANPNNPTGSLLPQAEMLRLRQNLPQTTLLVLDAAYAEYVTDTDYDPGVALVDATDNTVMLRTFSKVFGMGGMRVGWCYGPPPVIDVINRVRGVFNVNIAAQAAAVAALAEPGWVERSVAHNTEWRARLAAALQAAGIKVWPSHGNFLLADFTSPQRAKGADAFLRGRGIIVRGMAGYGLPHCLRITIGTAEECSMVADTLTTFMAAAGADDARADA
jgi:histidinol-phosphate aminotransferase